MHHHCTLLVVEQCLLDSLSFPRSYGGWSLTARSPRLFVCCQRLCRRLRSVRPTCLSVFVCRSRRPRRRATTFFLHSLCHHVLPLPSSRPVPPVSASSARRLVVCLPNQPLIPPNLTTTRGHVMTQNSCSPSSHCPSPFFSPVL